MTPRSIDDDRFFRKRRGDVSHCKSCRAPIVWATTANDKRMPMDAVPVDDGEWMFVDGRAVRFVSGSDLDVLRYDAHWATCPDSTHHRRVKVRDVTS